MVGYSVTPFNFRWTTMARFIEPFGWKAGELYGPIIPGPDKKNPNTSLYWVFSHPKYSCDPKTYLNFIVSDFGTKSNSSFATSLILETVNVWPINDGTEFATFKRSGSVVTFGNIKNWGT